MLSTRQIPTTGRNSSFQSKQWGYKDVQDLAKALPKNAIVIDVGAGLSKLGSDVVACRSDIRWINADPYYLEDASGLKNYDNPCHVPESILKPGSQLDTLNGNADIVYSYWMLPHLSLQDDEQAKTALKNMGGLLKNDGQLIIGPIKRLGFGLLSPFRYKGTIKINKAELLNENILDGLIRQTKLWWLPRNIQLLSNKHNIHLLKIFVGGSSKTS